MTIVASVKVRDGLTLATDSMTHIMAATPDGPQFVTAYENARKLFQLEDRPIGVMAYGLGNIGQRSIEGLMLDFGRTVSSGAVGEVAQELFTFAKSKYDALYAALPTDQQPALGFIVAGYSDGEAFPEEHEFLLPRDAGPQPLRPKDAFGVSWRGVDYPFVRVLKGFDPGLVEGLVAAGIDRAAIDALLPDLEMQVIYDGMPVQDAINFATYVLNTTIGYTQFSIGVPPCGGPLQIAIILPDRGFSWIARPELRAP